VSWQRVFFPKRAVPTRVAYAELLASVKVEWSNLQPAALARTVRAMLQGEIHLKGLHAIFDLSQDGLVSVQELQQALKLLLPQLSDDQAAEVSRRIAPEMADLTFGTVIDRLLGFVPPLDLPDPALADELAELRQRIVAWAKPEDRSPHTALWRFFQEFDEASSTWRTAMACSPSKKRSMASNSWSHLRHMLASLPKQAASCSGNVAMQSGWRNWLMCWIPTTQARSPSWS
ncbi:unnamed protein product, partial [Symbiodinium pilosum]